MKKQLLLILLCFTVINTTQAQIKQIVSADGVVLDNPYLHVNQNSTSYTLANNATIGTRIIAALEEVVINCF